MHKYGYFYTNEGRDLTLAVSNYINKSRYSNSKKIVSVPQINMELFNMDLPVNLSPSMNHLHLAQAFARAKGARKV